MDPAAHRSTARLGPAVGVQPTAAIARLDPDALHPARLAGTHAWAAWGLTASADPRHLELAISAPCAEGDVKELLDRLAAHLTRPAWPATDPPPIELHGRMLRYLGDGQPATIEILDLPWYQPASTVPPTGEAVTVDGWPVIDLAAAARQRFEIIVANGATPRDVTDITRWVQLETTHAAAHPTAPTRIAEILHRLRRDAPVAIAGIDLVIDHARGTYQQLVDPTSICEALQTLTNELARTSARRGGAVMSRR